MVVMTRGREQDHKTSNRMMQFRIACQALAILFLFLAYAAK
ncbi:MAG TPA: HIG1 domain-containing protein [Alphaproteobacteria bacterium]|nr:HIG1 domain-containing protein [Alphaproteobacteria bacterium]